MSAIDALQEERENLSARLVKVDAAIANMRDLFHLAPKAPRQPRSSEHVAKTIAKNGARTKLPDEAILSALRRGPLSPGALVAALGADRAVLRRRCGELEASGKLVLSGTTASRLITLSGRETGRKEPP